MTETNLTPDAEAFRSLGRSIGLVKFLKKTPEVSDKQREEVFDELLDALDSTRGWLTATCTKHRDEMSSQFGISLSGK